MVAKRQGGKKGAGTERRKDGWDGGDALSCPQRPESGRSSGHEDLEVAV